jgi:hypothetical protein
MFLELAPQLQGLSEAIRLHELHGHRPARPGLPPVQGPLPNLSLPKGLPVGGAGLPDPGMRLAAPLADVLHAPEPGRGPAVLCERLPGDAQEVQGRDRAQDNRGTRSDGRGPESGQEGC